jgi:hypothetical protein
VFVETAEIATQEPVADSTTANSQRLRRTMDLAEGVYFRHEREAFARIAQERFASVNERVGPWLQDNYDVLTATFMSILQLRRTRAGETLQHAFRALLIELEIPFQEQQIISGQPAFVIPDAETYRRDPLHARVIACKQTLRERWMQIIPEARNQGIFYLLTLDPDLASDALARMACQRVYVVVPSDVKQAH